MLIANRKFLNQTFTKSINIKETIELLITLSKLRHPLIIFDGDFSKSAHNNKVFLVLFYSGMHSRLTYFYQDTNNENRWMFWARFRIPFDFWAQSESINRKIAFPFIVISFVPNMCSILERSLGRVLLPCCSYLVNFYKIFFQRWVRNLSYLIFQDFFSIDKKIQPKRLSKYFFW